ncbi:MAG: response regulator [Oscillochloris sp.]|nr:response regulator [Oscillochloris sp.]
MSEKVEPCAILVVDDDFAIREVLSEVLDEAGYQAITASDGAGALAYLRETLSLPQVILLDLMMPVMTGWEFRIAQQQDQRLAEIPVVALSARPSLDHEQYTISVDKFMQKPVDLDHLLRLVENYCD